MNSEIANLFCEKNKARFEPQTREALESLKEKPIRYFSDNLSSDFGIKSIPDLTIIKMKLREFFGMDAETLELLNTPEEKHQYLDLGYTPDFWFYGLDIEGQDAIITSDKRIVRNKTELGPDDKAQKVDKISKLFPYSGYIGDLAPSIPKHMVKDYAEGTLKIDSKSLFARIVEKINYYMDFPENENKGIAEVQACWTIATYCYPLFYWFPHVLFTGPSDSGKSKNAKLLKFLSYRGFTLSSSGDVSSAQIFRTLEGNRGTILFDEFERRSGEQGKDTQQLVDQILNSSACQDDAYILRNVKGETRGEDWKPKKFPIFCPKIASNITGVTPTSYSRFIVFRMLKTMNRDKGKRKPYAEKDKAELRALGDNLYFLILDHWKELKQIYETLEIEELIGRDEDNWKPILTIATFLGPEIVEKVKAYIQDYKELRADSGSYERMLLDVLLGKVCPKNSLPLEFIDATPSDIAGWTNDSYSPDQVGRILTGYQFQKSRVGTKRTYKITAEKVKDTLSRYFGEQFSDTCDTSTTPGNNDKGFSVKEVVLKE